MPIYEYMTPDGRRHERISIMDYNPPREVEIDGQPARLVISAPQRVSVEDPESRRLAKRGIVPYERGMDRDARRAREYKDEKARKRRRRVVEDTVRDLNHLLPSTT